MPSLKLDRVLQLRKEIWMKIGASIKEWITEDALNGLYQNDYAKDRYRSKQYTKYKANEMRKFGKKKKSNQRLNYISGSATQSNLQLSTGGDRLKQYKGRAIVSTYIGYVNLTLTGELFRRLKPKDTTPDGNGVIMAYQGKENVAKVLGARKYGREIVGLNDKNKKLVKSALLKQFSANLNETLPKKLTIIVSGNTTTK